MKLKQKQHWCKLTLSEDLRLWHAPSLCVCSAHLCDDDDDHDDGDDDWLIAGSLQV